MAEPVSPVFPEFAEGQIILGAGDTDAMPLPVYPYRINNDQPINFISKWQLSEKEMEKVRETGCVYLIVTGGHPPVKIFGNMFLINTVPHVFTEPDPLEKLAE